MAKQQFGGEGASDLAVELQLSTQAPSESTEARRARRQHPMRRGPSSLIRPPPAPPITAFAGVSLSARLRVLFSATRDPLSIAKRRLSQHRERLLSEAAGMTSPLQTQLLLRDALMIDMTRHQNQLQSWGLQALLPPFRRLGQLRLAHASLMLETTTHAQRILTVRADEMTMLLDSIDSLLQRKEQHSTNDASADSTFMPFPEAFFQSPEQLLAADVTLTILHGRLEWMATALGHALASAREQTSALEPRAAVVRTSALDQLLRDFLQHDQGCENVDGRDCSFDRLPEITSAEMDSKVQSAVSADAAPIARLRRFEMAFAALVEDERTREGRLFRRWTALAVSSCHSELMFLSSDGQLETAPPYGSHDIADGDTSACRGAGGNSSGRDSNAQYRAAGAAPSREFMPPMPPKSVVAFTQYFAHTVVGVTLNTSAELLSALQTLTQSLIFKRIHTLSFGYQRLLVQRKDLRWRHQIWRARQLSPEAFGIPIEYFSRHASTDDSAPDESLAASKGLAASKDVGTGIGADHPTGVHGKTNSGIGIDTRLGSLGNHLSMSGEHAGDEPMGGIPGRIAGREAGLAGADSLAEVDAGGFGVDAPTILRTQIPCQRVYWRTSAALSAMSICLVPHEMGFAMMRAMRLLHREAANVRGGELWPLDADTMFPILVWSMVHAELPCVHACLCFMRHFAIVDSVGEAAYFLTCMEAAVSYVSLFRFWGSVRFFRYDGGGRFRLRYIYISRCTFLPDCRFAMRMSFPDDVDNTCTPALSYFDHLLAQRARGRGYLGDGATACSHGKLQGSSTKRAKQGGTRRGNQADTPLQFETSSNPVPTSIDEDDLGEILQHGWSRESEVQSIQQLGSWLSAQHAMEDTIDVLEKEGWMA